VARCQTASKAEEQNSIVAGAVVCSTSIQSPSPLKWLNWTSWLSNSQ
jgi:hypothetical protein